MPTAAIQTFVPLGMKKDKIIYFTTTGIILEHHACSAHTISFQ
jgi:hypothetical protein